MGWLEKRKERKGKEKKDKKEGNLLGGKLPTLVLVMSSCIRNWGLVGTLVLEENSERGQKLGSCAYLD